MKSILISIQPEWCGVIACGKKTLEIRKRKPKLPIPFKCFIYCTNPNTHNPNKILETHRDGKIFRCNGKVIGEFICDSIMRFDVPYPAFQSQLDQKIIEKSLCTYYMLHRYAYHDDLYGWNISSLKIYDKPKGLNEFGMKQPPQSWCYVEMREPMGGDPHA